MGSESFHLCDRYIHKENLIWKKLPVAKDLSIFSTCYQVYTHSFEIQIHYNFSGLINVSVSYSLNQSALDQQGADLTNLTVCVSISIQSCVH